jgi:hypothetical protein
MTARATLDAILATFGVRIVPTSRRRSPGDTHAGAVLQRILADHGREHLCLTLCLIRASQRNSEALHSEILGAMSDVLAQRPDWHHRFGELADAVDAVDLAELRDRAVQLRPWPVRGTLRTWVYVDLRDRLGEADEVEMAA